MAIRTQWHPKELRRAPDELAQMRGMLAVPLSQGGQQQAFAAGSTPALAPAVDISEGLDRQVARCKSWPQGGAGQAQAHRDDSVGRSSSHAPNRSDRQEERMRWPRW